MVLTFSCKQKTVHMLNWIVWNRTTYMYKNQNKQPPQRIWLVTRTIIFPLICCLYKIIIIMSRFKHGLLWLSLTIRLYHPSLPVGLLYYNLSPYGTIVDKFFLDGHHIHVHVKGSIGEHRLWVGPYPAMSRISCSPYSDGFSDGR